VILSTSSTLDKNGVGNLIAFALPHIVKADNLPGSIGELTGANGIIIIVSGIVLRLGVAGLLGIAHGTSF
jgi:hypothetical protein